MNSNEYPLAALDHIGIVDALYRFGAGQDLHDRTLLASSFTIDAILDFVQPAARLGVDLAPFCGRDSIVDSIMTTIRPLDTTHTITNARASIHAGRAELFALVDAYHLRQGAHDRFLQLKNIYRAELVRGEGDWLLHRVNIHNVWMAGEPSVLFG